MVPPMENDTLHLSRFDKGSHGKVLLPSLPRFIKHDAPVFFPSQVDGSMPPWNVFKATTGTITIQKNQQVGTWTGTLATEGQANKIPTSLYSCFPYVNLKVSFLKDFPANSSLLLLVWKWYHCFLLASLKLDKPAPLTK